MIRTGKNINSVIGIGAIAIVIAMAGCKQSSGKVVSGTDSIPKGDTIMSCTSNLPSRFAASASTDSIVANGKTSYAGMVKIPGGDYQMGAADKEGRPDEYPQHPVHV